MAGRGPSSWGSLGVTPKGERKQQPGSHRVTQEGPTRERTPRAKATGRERAGNVPAIGSRSAQLAPTSRDECQVQGWNSAQGQGQHERGQVSAARRPSRSLTADGPGRSPAPPRAPTLAAATPPPNIVPTGKTGKRRGCGRGPPQRRHHGGLPAGGGTWAQHAKRAQLHCYRPTPRRPRRLIY